MSCCGTRHYCTADGPVEVEPDVNGRYDIPEGGTTGWYKTRAEALEQCPQSLVCGDQRITIPPSVLYTTDDYVGDCVTASTTSQRMYAFVGEDGVVRFSPDPEPQHGFQFQSSLGCALLYFSITCDPEAPDPEKPFLAAFGQGDYGACITGHAAISPWVDAFFSSFWATILYFSQTEWEAGILYGPVMEVETSGSIYCVDGTFTLSITEDS